MENVIRQPLVSNLLSKGHSTCFWPNIKSTSSSMHLFAQLLFLNFVTGSHAKLQSTYISLARHRGDLVTHQWSVITYHWVSEWATFFYFGTQRATLETCDLWSEWWGDMTWPTFWQFLTILTIFDNFVNFWQFWKIMTVLENFGQFWQFWQLGQS